MKTPKIMRITSAVMLLVLTVGTFSAAAKDFTIGRKGEVHFNVPVRAGSALLKPGMYQVQHVLEGSEDIVSLNEHVVIFKQMEMPAGYRHSNTPVAKEAAARVKCTVEPAAKQVSNTRITLRTNDAGEKEIAEVQIAGEDFRHLF